MDEVFKEVLHYVVRGIELSGSAIILAGIFAAAGAFLAELKRGRSQQDAFRECRSSLGRAILLGLEFLVAADIINTVAIEPTLESLAVLAGIVLIRTFLSFSLEVEIEGRWPWQGKVEAPDGPDDAVAPKVAAQARPGPGAGVDAAGDEAAGHA